MGHGCYIDRHQSRNACAVEDFTNKPTACLRIIEEISPSVHFQIDSGYVKEVNPFPDKKSATIVDLLSKKTLL